MEEAIKAVKEAMTESGLAWGIIDFVNPSQVEGVKQECSHDFFDHEFVDQRESYSDGYCGCVYLPYQDGYFKVSFQM